MSRQLLSFGGPFLRRRADPLAAHAIGGVVPDVLYYPPGGLFYVDGAAVDAADIITLAGGATMDTGGIYIASQSETAKMNDTLRVALPWSTGVNIAMDGFVSYLDNADPNEAYFYHNPAGTPRVRAYLQTNSVNVGKLAGDTHDGTSGTSVATSGLEELSPGNDVAFSLAGRHMTSAMQVALNGTAGTEIAGTGTVPTPGSLYFGYPKVRPEQNFNIWRIRIWFGDVLGSGGIEEASGPFSI